MQPLLERFSAQFGEMLLHSLNRDPALAETSDRYFDAIRGMLRRHPGVLDAAAPRSLEVGCYRHVLGYRLAEELGFDVALFDICAEDLAEGRRAAREAGYSGDRVTAVAGDFHDLPFADSHFDFAFVSASLHHTWTPERVMGEMLRTVRDGGLFCCQREPSARLFCFYAFTANRRAEHTPFERHLADRDLLRLFSSPNPGTRNASVFGRIENDRIPLDLYLDVLSAHGAIVEEAIHFEGYLTPLDRRVLERASMPEAELARFIAGEIEAEIEAAAPLLGPQERLLGFALPEPPAVAALAESVAAALKALPPRSDERAWRRAMARIFGGACRFVLRRRGQARADELWRRPVEPRGAVFVDAEHFRRAGVSLWETLLPDLQTAEPEALARTFPAEDWEPFTNAQGARAMRSVGREARLAFDFPTDAVAVLRFRLALDEALPAARLVLSRDGREALSRLVPQSEDQGVAFECPAGPVEITATLRDLDGAQLPLDRRLRVSVLQAAPRT